MPVPDDPPRVWARRRPVNHPKQIEISGGIAAPLLAGFSLAAVAQLVIGSDHPRFAQWAVAAFVIAAVLFIYTVQLSALAVGLAATPSERLDYSPEASTQPDVLRAVRLRQWQETKLRSLHARRAGICYDGGVIAFLLGLGCLLVPYHLHPWPWGRFIGMGAVVIAVGIETLWALSGSTRPKWLLPDAGTMTVTPDVLADNGRSYLFPDRSDSPAEPTGVDLLTSPRSGAAENREWKWTDVAMLLLFLGFGFALVFMGALALPPFTGTRILWGLGIFSSAGANVALGTLLVGTYIEIRHKAWSRLHGIDHIVLGGSLLGLLVADSAFGWYLFANTQNSVRFGFLAVAAVSAAAGGFWSWRKLWPHRRDPTNIRPWGQFHALSGVVGGGVGILSAVLLLVGSAIQVNAAIPATMPIPIVHGITGRYLAIGDSYTAGEGLEPFVAGTKKTYCDRSQSQAYPELLKFASGAVTATSTACSSAIIHDVLNPTIRNGSLVRAQIDGKVHPDVGLVTFTLGGDNALFSKIVIACFEESRCLDKSFPPKGVKSVEPVPAGQLGTTWAQSTLLAIGKEYAHLFPILRHDFPKARIVAIGYPYLFPAGSAPVWPLDCFSVLRRFSEPVRDGLRNLQTEFNNVIYEEAVAAHIEFVSPVAIWQGHEPCGSRGQYTNSIKPYMSFKSPVDGGTFHPNSAGQSTFARLVACYLNAYPQPPDPQSNPSAHGSIPVPTDRLATPDQLGLVDPPGSEGIPGCSG